MRNSHSAPMHRVRDVASELVVSEKTVRRLIDNGEIRTHRVGRSIRISEEDLAAYRARNRR
jgi:excisionase family DNA binding protein